MSGGRVAFTVFGALVGTGGVATLVLLVLLMFTSAYSNSYGGDYGITGIVFLASLLPVSIAGAAIGGIAAWRWSEPGHSWSTRPFAALTILLFTLIVVTFAAAVYLDL